MRDRWMWGVVAVLLALSAGMYAGLHVVFPQRTSDIGFYTLLDVAFIPLNVVLVGLFIDRILAARERANLLHKMNMVVGAFFAEMGAELIERLAAFDRDIEHDRPHLMFDARWTARDYEAHRASVAGDRHPMVWGSGDVEGLRDALARGRPFLVSLLQNGNMLEHETFTDMLWAVSHLGEELAARPQLRDLPQADLRHIEVDMGRAYGRLLGEYLLYVRHLAADYPYLFSFAVRTNPFDPSAAVEVRGTPAGE